MKKTLLMVLALSSCVSCVVGGEQPTVVAQQKNYTELNKPVEIFVHFQSDARDLYYVGKKKIDYINPKLVVHSPCFINCEYRSEDLRTNLDGMLNSVVKSSNMNTKEDYNQYRLLEKSVRLQKITEKFKTLHSQNVIPLCYFLTDADQFKNKGDVLFTFTEKVEEDEILFEIKLGEDLSNIDAKQIITQFCNDEPQHITDDHYELQENGIIQFVQGYRHNSGSYKHGTSSYKVERDKIQKSREIEVEKQQQAVKQQQVKAKKEQEDQERKAIFYSKLKKIGGFSMTAILMYILYQKFYAAA